MVPVTLIIIVCYCPFVYWCIILPEIPCHAHAIGVQKVTFRENPAPGRAWYTGSIPGKPARCCHWPMEASYLKHSPYALT
jgi:hypothetical protein